MDIVTTSLDALLQRATNPHNQNVDVAAVEAFCALVNKEKDGVNIGVKLLAAKIHSVNEKEVLQALNLLDTCMLRCGAAFQSEIGKFRFLNEMIKLVSPKYLGSQTPLSIRQKVLQLMYVWTLDYPKENKIREAYDMLKKQGVIKEVPSLSVSADSGLPSERKSARSVFHDEEKSKLLQKLLQSKNPDDLQAANRLIKSMVKEDDKRAEMKSRKVAELESVNNNVRLLNEMLDSYKPGRTSQDELDLIGELRQSCDRLRVNMFKLASETQQNEDMLNEILRASDELGQVIDKYKNVISDNKLESHSNLSLLDLENAADPKADLEGISREKQENATGKSQADVDILCDIFTAIDVPPPVLPVSSAILQPSTALSNSSEKSNGKAAEKTSVETTNSKCKGLEDLDVLGEHLLKENLPSNLRMGQYFNKNSEKIPMNLLAAESKSVERENKENSLKGGELLNFDPSFLENKSNAAEQAVLKQNDKNADDCLVDVVEKKEAPAPKTNGDKCVESKLNDIFISLENIKPSSVPPLTILNDKNSITVTLHVARDKPREDVNVFVITTISKNELPLTNYLFQAVVPKKCKVKLQRPSSTELPVFNPFIPPSAITQIMLVANPEEVEASLKFVLSYTMDDETVTEIGEVDKLPVL